MSGPSSCRRCHAPLPKPDDDGNAVCPSCGLFHHVDDAPAATAVPPPPPPTGPFGAGAPSGAPGQGQASRAAGATTTARRRVRGPGLGCGIAALVVLAVSGVIVVAIVAGVRSATDGGPGGGLELTLSTGDAEVVTDGDGRPTEIVALAHRAGSGDRVVARVDVDGEVAWTASIVPGDVSSAQLRLTDDDLVLASLGDTVVALDGETGTVAWQATVSDEVDPRCRDCLTVLDDQVVVFSRDAYVTALDLDDGSSTWTRRLASPRGSVHVVDGTLLVVDEGADPEARTAIVLTDPATGDELGSFTPSCPDPAYGPDSDQTVELDVGSPIVPIPGTEDVVVLFGFGSTCVQRWNLLAQEMRWSGVAADVSSLSDPTFTVDGTDLVVVDSSTVFHVSLSEGTIAPLPMPPDSQPAESAVLSDGRLVVAVHTTRGTTRWSLVAVDLRRREILWERGLPRGAEAFDLSPSRSSDTLFEGNARFVVAPLDAERVALVTLASPGARLTVEAVDVATGRGREVGRGTFALRYEGSSSPSSRIEAITGGTVVFSTESIPQVLDLATGRVTSSWAD